MIGAGDAFSLSCTPSFVGVPLLGRKLLELATGAGVADSGPLGAQIDFYRRSYDLWERRAAQRLEDLERQLRRHALPVPERPVSSAGFAPWRDAITTAVLHAVPQGSTVSLAAVMGVQLGDALLAEELIATALALLVHAPGMTVLSQQARALAAQLTAAGEQIGQLSALPMATPALRRLGAEIASKVSAAPSLDPEGIDDHRAALVRRHAGELDLLRQALVTALAAVAVPAVPEPLLP